MEKRNLEIAAVQITAFQQKLLQESDPAIANKTLIRVPLGEGLDIGWSAQDWTHSWHVGSIEFTDNYYLEHKGKSLPKDDLDKLQTYIYVNQLDPMVVQNWTVAFDRLIAVGLIHQEAPPVPLQDEPKDETPQFIDIERMPSRTLEERKALRAATLSNLMLEAQPVVDQFFADLNAAGHYPTYAERRAMAEYVENHNLFPHQRKSWDRALTLFPKYLDEEKRALIALDRDDGPGTYVTADEIKKAVGKASPRVGYAVQNR